MMLLPLSSSIPLLLFLLSLPIFSAKSTRRRQPNIVLLITDDQDVQLGSLDFMPKTVRLLRQRGTEFANAFVSTPICCPSRSSILTGLYAHNHHVMTNNQNCSGPAWRNVHENGTFAVHLSRAGYRTGYFGKYLNEYDGTWIPPGWHQWMAIVRNSRYYNYSLNVNGQMEWHGFDYQKDYSTDLVANQSIQFMRQSILDHPNVPFLAVVSFPAPHGPEDPAPQFSQLFHGIETHRTRSWNYAPNPDKQWLLQRTGKMEPVHVAFTDQMHRRRLQTLQSVDDAVAKLVFSLRSLNQLHNTFLLYTSDHGYHLGQFGLVKGKSMPYEFDIRVPFFLRGPGVSQGKIINSIVANIDIAPTILAMAGLDAPEDMDGRSILDLPELADVNGAKRNAATRWRETVLIERGKMPKLGRLRDRLKKQRERLSKERRLGRECAKAKYQGGCKLAGQHWQCLRQNGGGREGRWRIEKCPKKCECRGGGGGRKRREKMAEEKGWEDVWDEGGMMEEDGQRQAEEEEEEFLREMEERQILESGQWHQGIFGGDDDELDWEGEDGEEEEEAMMGRRGKREADDRKREEEEGMVLLKACADQNVRFCQRWFNGSWGNDDANTILRKGKSRLNSKIVALRRRLSSFKNLRKALVRSNRANLSEHCECQTAVGRRRHPLLGKTFASDLRRQRASKRGNSNSSSPSSSSSIDGTSPPLSCHIAQMNCFHHSPQHWRTPPLWPREFGQFCFCQNANNNSYWCLRTINSTHNFLYCEFVTEELSFHDLSKDPHQLVNSVHELAEDVLEQLSGQLRLLKSCQGKVQCEEQPSKWNEAIGREIEENKAARNAPSYF